MRLPPPAAFRAQLLDAMAAGRQAGAQLPSMDRPAVVKAAIASLAPVPSADATKVELGWMRDIAAARTPEGIAAARFYDTELGAVWEPYMREFARREGPGQAARAVRMLWHTYETISDAVHQAKAGTGRPRPYTQDPTLPLAVRRPKDLSYPSGHAAGAAAAATIFSQLLPDKRDEIATRAAEAAWARVYGGVHFPSDVLEGVKIGAFVAVAGLRSAEAATRSRGARAA